MKKFYVYHDRLGYRIPIFYRNNDFYKKIKKDLTISSKDYHTKKIQKIKYYYETNKALLIPRLFPIHKYIHDDLISPLEKYYAKKIKINSNITPRNDLQYDSIEYLLHNPHVLLQLSPGSGKTVITIDVICKIKYKTIIFVHRDSLLTQWIDRLLTFTDISKNKIGILSSESYSYVLQDSDIILSTVQAFNAILRNNNIKLDFLRKMYNSGIGILVGDEVHTSVGAPKFSMASLLTPCHRTIGLSATPDKQDGSFRIIKYHLGEIYKSPYESDTMPADVHVILIDYDLLNSRKNWLYWNGEFQYSRYYQVLRKSKNLMNILDIIINHCADENRNIVVMCERLKLIDDLMNKFKKLDCAKFTSKEKLDVLTHKYVFTTPGKMRDGIDAPWKDTIIMTSPISNIDQAIGRIVRIDENKLQPNVFDLVDIGIKQIKSTFKRKRLPYYTEKKWNVYYYTIKNNKLTEISKTEAKQLFY